MRKVEEHQCYIPLEDEIALTWRIITKEETENYASQIDNNDVESPEITSQNIALEGDLFDLIQHLTHKEPEIARAIHLLNRKINTLTKSAYPQTSQASLLSKKPEPVQISPKGISFHSPKRLRPGSHIQIEMIIGLNNTYILSFGVVIGCEEQEIEFHIQVDFVAMREDAMESLIDYLMQKEDEMKWDRRNLHE